MKADKDLSSTSQFVADGLPAAPAIGEMKHLEEIMNSIHQIAERDRADPIALLGLLRALEQLHRDIQQGYFQDALPNSRQSLYAMLRDIEENGGWPYIQRWKLQELFANLPDSEK
jgi:hypothetical protein